MFVSSKPIINATQRGLKSVSVFTGTLVTVQFKNSETHISICTQSPSIAVWSFVCTQQGNSIFLWALISPRDDDSLILSSKKTVSHTFLHTSWIPLPVPSKEAFLTSYNCRTHDFRCKPCLSCSLCNHRAGVHAGCQSDDCSYTWRKTDKGKCLQREWSDIHSLQVFLWYGNAQTERPWTNHNQKNTAFGPLVLVTRKNWDINACNILETQSENSGLEESATYRKAKIEW